MLTKNGGGDRKRRLSRVHCICTMHCVQCTLEKQCTANHVIKLISIQWCQMVSWNMTRTSVDVSSVSSCGSFSENVHVTHENEFENYIFKITSSCPSGQWVGVFRPKLQGNLNQNPIILIKEVHFEVRLTSKGTGIANGRHWQSYDHLGPVSI